MNEAGLVFDYFATPSNPVTTSLHKPDYQGSLFTKIMEECRTVEEALEILDQYNLRSMEKFMTLLADQKGNSVIIEGDKIIRKSGNFQVVTNFYQSQHPNGVKENGNSACWRYAKANAMLKNETALSKEKAKDILSAIHQDGKAKTMYSNIYDVKNGLVHLYFFHDFDNEVTINVKDELQKESRGFIDIESLFPRNAKAENYENGIKQTMKTRIGNRNIIDVSPKTLEHYCHTYKHEDRSIKPFVKDGILHLEFAEDVHAPLQAFSDTEFFAQIFLYDFIFDFQFHDDQEIKGFWMHETLYYEGKEHKTSRFFKKVD